MPPTTRKKRDRSSQEPDEPKPPKRQMTSKHDLSGPSSPPQKRPCATPLPSRPYMRSQTPGSSDPAWSRTSDTLLLSLKASGTSWSAMPAHFPGKTANACRKRYSRLVANKQVEWTEGMERDLAREVWVRRVGLMKDVGKAVGLEWQHVERKCVEIGWEKLLEMGKAAGGGSPADPEVPDESQDIQEEAPAETPGSSSAQKETLKPSITEEGGVE